MTDTTTTHPLDPYRADVARRRLRVQTVDAKPIDTDWEDIDELEVYEAVRCDECGNVIFDADQHVPGCPCGSSDASELGAEGPMMNYRYPVDLGDFDDLRMAAAAIVDLPLCIVDIDGDHFLALTGGGMDLSWEICEAYVRLGCCPPVHFCADLPRMGGMKLNGRTGLVLAAAERSIEVSGEWAEARSRRIESLVADLVEGV